MSFDKATKSKSSTSGTNDWAPSAKGTSVAKMVQRRLSNNVSGEAVLQMLSGNSSNAVQFKSDEEEVLTKVKAYSESIGGYKSTFDKHAVDGLVDQQGVVAILDAAGVAITKLGLPVPNSVVAGKVLKKFDTDSDGKISWDEFNAGIAG